jgi:3-oxoacyl-[acyl-carrier protein] reductase
MRLEGKVALVTGAGSGIGRGVALEFAKEGAHVIINDLRRPDAKAANGDGDGPPAKRAKPAVHIGDAEATAAMIREMGREALVCYADVSKRDEVAKMVEDGVKKFGVLDICVSNAYFSDRVSIRSAVISEDSIPDSCLSTLYPPG